MHLFLRPGPAVIPSYSQSPYLSRHFVCFTELLIIKITILIIKIRGRSATESKSVGVVSAEAGSGRSPNAMREVPVPQGQHPRSRPAKGTRPPSALSPGPGPVGTLPCLTPAARDWRRARAARRDPTHFSLLKMAVAARTAATRGRGRPAAHRRPGGDRKSVV